MLSTFTKILYDMPMSFFTIQSAINNRIIVGSEGLKHKYLNIASAIKLMLQPKSHNALASLNVPMMHGMVNAPGSPFF